jgi:hypothetical protein
MGFGQTNRKEIEEEARCQKTQTLKDGTEKEN